MRYPCPQPHRGDDGHWKNDELKIWPLKRGIYRCKIVLKSREQKVNKRGRAQKQEKKKEDDVKSSHFLHSLGKRTIHAMYNFSFHICSLKGWKAAKMWKVRVS